MQDRPEKSQTDKSAYRACNSNANESYGKKFFAQIALAASSLWPVFIALGWMQYRFAGVEFSPLLLGAYVTFGYVSTFLLCSIAVRYFFGKIRMRQLFTGPVFRREHPSSHVGSSALR